MGRTNNQIDRTATYRLANLGAVIVVWLGWTVYSLLNPTIDLVPSEYGIWFLIVGLAIGVMAIFTGYYSGGHILPTITGVVAGVALLIGIVIVGDFQSSLPTTTVTSEQGNLITTSFSTAFGAYSLAPILLIIIIAIIIMYFITGRVVDVYSKQ